MCATGELLRVQEPSPQGYFVHIWIHLITLQSCPTGRRAKATLTSVEIAKYASSTSPVQVIHFVFTNTHPSCHQSWSQELCPCIPSSPYHCYCAAREAADGGQNTWGAATLWETQVVLGPVAWPSLAPDVAGIWGMTVDGRALPRPFTNITLKKKRQILPVSCPWPVIGF